MNIKNITVTLITSLFIFCVFNQAIAADSTNSAFANLQSSAPEDAGAYFIDLEDGSTVAPTFTVRFGLNGMGVAPAGADFENTGHHHLLIDLTELPANDMPLPANDNVKHFGKGQTETELTLAPGTHTLQLILGNHFHIPHSPAVVSDKITITVK